MFTLKSRVAHRSADEYTLGDRDPLVVDVSVENRADDAFQSVLHVDIPSGVLFQSYEPRRVLTCTLKDQEPEDRTGGRLTCELGNPLKRHQRVDLQLAFEPLYVDGSFRLRFNVSSLNTDRDGTMGDNVREMDVKVLAEARLELDGFAVPDQVRARDYGCGKLDGRGLA